MASSESNQKLGPVVGYAQLLGDDHGLVHNRRSWRLLINAAVAVLLLSCAFANSSLADEKTVVANRYNELGIDAYTKGQYRKAIGYYEKSLAINREALGEKHAHVATSYNNLGLAWNNLGQYQKSIGYFEKALAIFRGALPKGHLKIRQVEANLAVAKKQQTR